VICLLQGELGNTEETDTVRHNGQEEQIKGAQGQSGSEGEGKEEWCWLAVFLAHGPILESGS